MVFLSDDVLINQVDGFLCTIWKVAELLPATKEVLWNSKQQQEDLTCGKSRFMGTTIAIDR